MMPIEFNGDVKIESSQIIDKVEGDAVLNVGLSAKDVQALISKIQELAVKHDFIDDKLTEVISTESGGSIFLSKITEYLSFLNNLFDAGELTEKYGPGAIDFFQNFTSLMSGIC